MKVGVQTYLERLYGKKKDNNVSCERCQSSNIKEDSHRRSHQKYFYKQCKRWFNDRIDSIFHYCLHTPLKVWFLVMYVYFIFWPGCSLREISLEVVIPYPRRHRFIRTDRKNILFLR
jgi:transposase-like protein